MNKLLIILTILLINFSVNADTISYTVSDGTSGQSEINFKREVLTSYTIKQAQERLIKEQATLARLVTKRTVIQSNISKKQRAENLLTLAIQEQQVVVEQYTSLETEILLQLEENGIEIQ